MPTENFYRDYYGITSNNEHAIFSPLNNYIYFYHTGVLLQIPTYPENIGDHSQANFNSNTPLSRSAPIYSYANSGPRSISFQFQLHRDMMKQVQGNFSSPVINSNEDYTEILINNLEACSVPKYSDTSKMIDPPMAALKIENSIFIKGVVKGGVGVDWHLPMLRDGKYAYADVSFTIEEVTPYSAEQIQRIGSYRDTGDMPLSTTLTSNIFTLDGARGGGRRTLMAR